MTSGTRAIIYPLYISVVKKIAFIILVFSTALLMTHNLLPHTHERVNQDHEAVYSNTPPTVSFFDYFKIALQLDLGVEHLDHYNNWDQSIDFEYHHHWESFNEALVSNRLLLLEHNSLCFLSIAQEWPAILFLENSPFRGPPRQA